ncbi:MULTISPECIES: periplasmic heavy metal sensor [Mesorhizobium]|jgi:uncharacterized membrane protein|uniref:Uncharacterized membrane protein n=2 Tax=Mesorhizobium TaxID=68287 RepID=A0A1G8UQ80_9HYPH|nr:MULTISPECIES: periplasmic heavy metal sensor [Mesorhizobium]MCF6102318.1 periplasmic heavy metal sensor [Mesorhizobium muleiense]RWA99681.1 MAG: periplasmic heavy metal sensor [Mesorhizobium sp.]RWC00470.1 MAG: periplasmic heavy metal sensor [Mesorhizobium sp.]RWN52486.1 MAG: periplasmic heavy metal sensor [Mesorhizobium sp.]RWN60085.1 MAG: periplasmic heavy metal sensor [Mesorhizobium sp.]
MSERSIRILLAVSLALNVFVLGAAAGAGYIWQAQQGQRDRAGDQRGLRFAAAGLSPDQRKAFRQALAEARRQSAADIEAARVGREAVARLIEAEPIDAAAVNETLASVRQADMALRGRLEQAIVTFATGLTPADRARLVDGLRGRSNMLRRAGEK